MIWRKRNWCDRLTTPSQVEGLRGFSLIELLIAFFVLLVGILAVLVLFPLGLRESKTMVDASTAALIARNARQLMETHPFTYNSGSKGGNGTASIVQIRRGPRGVKGNIFIGSFPVMFPEDVLGSSDDGTFPLNKVEGAPFYRPERDIGGGNKVRDLVVSAESPQFSWDARFTIGGGPGLTPPPGNFLPYNKAQAPYDDDWYWIWFSQYFKYYAVQISVYRNYQEIPIGQGTVWVKAANKPASQGGGPYDTNDPNRPLYSELVLSNQPPADVTVDSYVRFRGDKSDWYRVTDMKYQSNNWVLRLDRPYAALSIQQLPGVSAVKNDIIATNSLIESFTTILASQLDDIDTSTVSP